MVSVSERDDAHEIRQLEVAELNICCGKGGNNTVVKNHMITRRCDNHSGGALFEASHNFDIYGGSIMSAGGNITIYNGPPSQSEATDSKVGIEAEESVPLQMSASAVPPQRSSQRASEIYHQNLITKKRGSPLWIPEPPYSLPTAYRKKGVSIGDVGILSASGTFDFFFNIFHSSDDPINSRGVPEGFEPLDPPLSSMAVRRVQEYYSGSYVASESVKTSRRPCSDSQTSELVFQSSAAEGAILTLPKGARSEDVIGTTLRLRAYIAKNIESWYRYIILTCDCNADNGDVLLVTGCDKTDSWGVAAFVKSTEAVQLKFLPLDTTNDSYKWEYSGSFEARAGPDQKSIEGLRVPGDEGDEKGQDPIKNQCVFIRTLTATLRDDVWQKMKKNLYLEVGLDQSDDMFGDNDMYPGTQDISSDNGKGIPGTSTLPLQTGQHDLDIPPSGATYMINHPSKLLNQFLWRNSGSEFSDARIVITEDNDWISVLRNDDHQIPRSEELYRRIMERDFKSAQYPNDGFLNRCFSEKLYSLYAFNHPSAETFRRLTGHKHITSIGAFGMLGRSMPYPSPIAGRRMRYGELEEYPNSSDGNTMTGMDLGINIGIIPSWVAVGAQEKAREQPQRGYNEEEAIIFRGTSSQSHQKSTERSTLSGTDTPFDDITKKNVTTRIMAGASIGRREQAANFACTVPGCDSTFTTGFDLKGHLRSHYEQKPYKCHWPGCGKGFARQHDCKRHEQLHSNYRPFECEGCRKQFARMDALNRHLRSEAGTECAKIMGKSTENGGIGIPGSGLPMRAKL